MAFAIDSEVRGSHIYKDFWCAGHWISLFKVCNREDRYAITHAPMHCNPHVTLLIVVMGINFHRKAVTRNLFLKRKTSSNIRK